MSDPMTPKPEMKSQAQRIQQEAHEAAVRENEQRMAKLREATRCYEHYARTGEEGHRLEGDRLFQESGMPPGGTFPGYPPPGFTPDVPNRAEEIGPGRIFTNPPKQAETAPAPAEPVNYLELAQAFMPLVEALLPKEGAPDKGRRRAFQNYAFALMAGGMRWAEAACLAHNILNSEDAAAGGPGVVPEDPPARGWGFTPDEVSRVGLGGSGG